MSAGLTVAPSATGHCGVVPRAGHFKACGVGALRAWMQRRPPWPQAHARPSAGYRHAQRSVVHRPGGAACGRPSPLRVNTPAFGALLTSAPRARGEGGRRARRGAPASSRTGACRAASAPARDPARSDSDGHSERGDAARRVFSIFVALAYQGSSEYLSTLFDERKKTVRRPPPRRPTVLPRGRGRASSSVSLADTRAPFAPAVPSRVALSHNVAVAARALTVSPPRFRARAFARRSRPSARSWRSTTRSSRRRSTT